MIPPITRDQQLIDQNGRPTMAFLQILQEMAKAIDAGAAFADAVAEVTAPVGGGTVDTEARAAIAAIISA
jgi:hypothetical protein